MLDRLSLRLLAPALNHGARILHRRGISPDLVSLAGFGFGLGGGIAIAWEYYRIGLALLLVNRMADGIDGALARLGRSTDQGAYLDICLDMMIYSGLVFCFALAEPDRNALPAAALLVCFTGTGSTFLAYGILAERKRLLNRRLPDKGFYYLGGLVEGTETVVFLAICCLFPAHFPVLAWSFGAICAIAALLRLVLGYRALSATEHQ